MAARQSNNGGFEKVLTLSKDGRGAIWHIKMYNGTGPYMLVEHGPMQVSGKGLGSVLPEDLYSALRAFLVALPPRAGQDNAAGAGGEGADGPALPSESGRFVVDLTGEDDDDH